MSTASWRPDEVLGGTLNTTRKIRFALEVMWSEIDFLPDQISATDDVRDAPARRAYRAMAIVRVNRTAA